VKRIRDSPFHHSTRSIPIPYLAAAIIPQAGQRRLSSSVIQRSISGLSCVPRSVTWKASSRMMVGTSCTGARQYHRKRSISVFNFFNFYFVRGNPHSYIPMAASGRTRSITIPTVSAKRTGLWGVLPVRRHTAHERTNQCPCNP
jgi:hypothetical protein